MGTLSHERSNLKELESILAVTVICSFHIDMVNLIPATFFAVCDKSREQRLSTNNEIYVSLIPTFYNFLFCSDNPYTGNGAEIL